MAAEAHYSHPAEEGGTGRSLAGVVAHNLPVTPDYSLAWVAADHNPAEGFAVHTAGGAAVHIAGGAVDHIAGGAVDHIAEGAAVHIAAEAAVHNLAVVHILAGVAAGMNTDVGHDFERHHIDQAVELRTVPLMGHHTCWPGVEHSHLLCRRRSQSRPTAF